MCRGWKTYQLLIETFVASLAGKFLRKLSDTTEKGGRLFVVKFIELFCLRCCGIYFVGIFLVFYTIYLRGEDTEICESYK